MNAQHTPGPWRMSEGGVVDLLPEGSNWSFWFAPGFSGIGPNPSGQNPRQERDANAQLIAAAPELLEALRAAENHFGPFAEITINGQHDPDDVRVTALMRAAIAKATGGAA